MIEIESKTRYNSNSKFEEKELSVNGIPFEKLSVVDKSKLWKALSKHIESKIINNKSLSKDPQSPFTFQEFVENFIIRTGKFKKLIIKDSANEEVGYLMKFSLRMYDIWDDVIYFFKDLFKKEK